MFCVGGVVATKCEVPGGGGPPEGYREHEESVAATGASDLAPEGQIAAQYVNV